MLADTGTSDAAWQRAMPLAGVRMANGLGGVTTKSARDQPEECGERSGWARRVRSIPALKRGLGAGASLRTPAVTEPVL